ncbi:MAG: hypothetical protein SPL00_01760 [Bacilli bacterium]|nr:hypothetical protein [Bacilli bacterium]
MNQISEVITTLIHYGVAVRDTLEYCIRKDHYEVPLYKEKKRSILVEVDQHTPLKDIIDHSGENGEKLEKLIRDFHAEVYGDSSTILSLATEAGDNGETKEVVRVDHNQHLAIYKYVLPVYENINSMLKGVIKDGHTKNLDIAEAEKVYKTADAMYRAVAFLTLVGDLNRLFNEYNQARNEAKGEETPASKFIGNDISSVIQNIRFVEQNAGQTDAIYKNMEDKINSLMEMMTGRRDLPAGKKFPDVMKEAVETINLYVRDAEAAFRAGYGPLIQALLAQVKEDDAKRAAGETASAGGTADTSKSA